MVWRTFDPRDRADRLADGFGTIEALDENRLPPRGDVPGYAAEQVEIVTYVREGAIVYEDAMGHSGAYRTIVLAGCAGISPSHRPMGAVIALVVGAAVPTVPLRVMAVTWGTGA
jgi:hypothetical protein